MSTPTPIPPISEEEMTPLVSRALLTKVEEYAGIILALKENVQLLKDEIAVLKGQKPRPKIPPNKLDKDKPGSSGTNNQKEGEGQ